MRKLAAVFLSGILLLLMGCTNTEKPGEASGGEKNLLPDNCFEQGFILTGFDSRPEYNQRHIGEIDYGETGLEPIWRIGQWGCKKNLVDAVYTQEDGMDVFRDGSKELKVNRSTGAFTLNCNAEADGVYADGPRKENEPWIHFILEVPQFSQYTMLKDIDYLTFYLEFQLTKGVNQCGAGYNPGLHSSMFLWYVTINDITKPSDYFWFGLPIYDNRSDYSPEFAAQDGGKEDSTGAFIFNPAGNTFLDMPVKPGNHNILSRDMLPVIRHAFELAQSRGFLKNTKYENLGITSMYIGWELPGTFDVGMDVNNMKLLAGKANK
ncbi:MAG: hypothetical protein ACLRL0_10530 [Christensenellaceae bacterium]